MAGVAPFYFIYTLFFPDNRCPYPVYCDFEINLQLKLWSVFLLALLGYKIYRYVQKRKKGIGICRSVFWNFSGLIYLLLALGFGLVYTVGRFVNGI